MDEFAAVKKLRMMSQCMVRELSTGECTQLADLIERLLVERTVSDGHTIRVTAEVEALKEGLRAEVRSPTRLALKAALQSAWDHGFKRACMTVTSAKEQHAVAEAEAERLITGLSDNNGLLPGDRIRYTTDDEGKIHMSLEKGPSWGSDE